MARPFFSVPIDTYNHERSIEEAVESVLAQDVPFSDREILVVDDASTDRTPEILRKFEPHIRTLQKQNGGQASAFNFGIPECRGEVVAFLDGDDWWAPGKLKQVARRWRKIPIAYTRAPTDQLRLSLEGGWPWETFHTEKTFYQVNYPDAPFSQRLLKSLMLSATLVVPPVRYYRTRQGLLQNRFYRWFRQHCSLSR